MREIIFRGKSISTGSWAYGDLVKTEDGSVLVNFCKVHPETVGQYLGIKDNNGNKIFEGDVVKCWGGEYCQGYWEYNDKITINHIIYDGFMLGEYENLKIIGNIYDKEV